MTPTITPDPDPRPTRSATSRGDCARDYAIRSSPAGEHPTSLNLSQGFCRPKAGCSQRGIKGRHQSRDGQAQSCLNIDSEILPTVPEGPHHNSGQIDRISFATHTQTMNLQ